jgi:hypothetical protein
MRYVLFTAIAAIVLTGCDGPTTTGGMGTAGDDSDSSGGGTDNHFAKVEPENLSIGDAEQRIFIQAYIDDDNFPEGVTQRSLRDPRDALNLAIVNVPYPYPDELLVTFEYGAKRSFEATPVALRGRFHIDEKTVFSIADVITLDGVNNLIEHVVNIMDYIEEVPESVLIEPEFTIVITQPGTDPASIDPETVTEEPLRMSTALITNPMRITFDPAPDFEFVAPPASEAPTVATPEISAPSEPGEEPEAVAETP